MAKKINTALYKSTGGGFDMSKLPTANILREVEVTAKKPVQKNQVINNSIYQSTQPVVVREQDSLINLPQMGEFEVVANRINRPQAGIEKPQSNALHNDYRYGPEAVGISNRKIIEAFKPEYDAELQMTNDSTAAFNNMLENRQIYAPRASTKTDKNLYSPEYLRRAIIMRSHNYRPL